MNPSPSREKLELLTTKKLGLDDQAAVATHVQGCTTCQQTVASLSPFQPTEHYQPPPQVEGDADGRGKMPEELRFHPRYQVQGVLGRGGMGTVYKAEHRLLERPVVLKVIRHDLVSSPTAVARFQREAKL